MARASPPPAARSSSAREAGRAGPCASATASKGVSTWASGAVASVLVISDLVDYALGELRGRDFVGAPHLARQVVSDAPSRYRPREHADDRVWRSALHEFLAQHGRWEEL